MAGPIQRFLSEYRERGAVRAHMPGHKGVGGLSEEYDLTEITGADSLFAPDGIIKESERAASELFGAVTFYSTEGSSLSIRAMIYLTRQYAAERGERAKILAARNAHKVFISAVAMTGVEVEWLCCSGDSYLDAGARAEAVRERLASGDLPTAVYITSPDYLGDMADIREIAEACHDFGVLLLVDNAHGAYLKFLPESRHPIDLGADMCCDSAHKTLPCLTGGAYLHIAKDAPSILAERAKSAMATFGSTSPSYLILASLDGVNGQLSCGYPAALAEFCEKMYKLKAQISQHGYTLTGDEPLKITVKAKDYGYLGYELGRLLEERNIYAEFADPDYLVLMLSPATKDCELETILSALLSVPRRERIESTPPKIGLPERALSPRVAMLSPRECIPARYSVGRILADVTVGCPPAVPIVVSGEKIDTGSLFAFDYYGIDKVWVVK